MDNEDVQSKDAFCYCAINRDNRIFKVGYSKNVNARIKQQNGVNLIQIELKMVCAGSRLIESALHYRLRQFKYNADKKREWFSLNDNSAAIVGYHFEHGFSRSYLRRVLWRRDYRSNKYAERVAKLTAKRPPPAQFGPNLTGWAPVAARLIASRRNEVFELERKFSIPSGHRMAFSDIAKRAESQAITERQYSFICGIIKSYTEAPQISAKMISGEYSRSKADKQCKICSKTECKCGLKLTRKAISMAIWEAFGGVEFARRHGYGQPSEGLKVFLVDLQKILETHGVMVAA